MQQLQRVYFPQFLAPSVNKVLVCFSEPQHIHFCIVSTIHCTAHHCIACKFPISSIQANTDCLVISEFINCSGKIVTYHLQTLSRLAGYRKLMSTFKSPPIILKPTISDMLYEVKFMYRII